MHRVVEGLNIRGSKLRDTPRSKRTTESRLDTYLVEISISAGEHNLEGDVRAVLHAVDTGSRDVERYAESPRARFLGVRIRELLHAVHGEVIEVVGVGDSREEGAD